MGRARQPAVRAAREISETLDMPLDEAERIVEQVIASVVRALKRREPVTIQGFGRFFVYTTKPLRYNLPRMRSQPAVRKTRVRFVPYSPIIRQLNPQDAHRRVRYYLKESPQ